MAKNIIPKTLDYFQGTMYEALKNIAQKYASNIAFDFMGKSTSYKKLMENVDRCAIALKDLGIKEQDRITIAMPNCPQAIYIFYAVNKIGAVANMVHPLSSEKELEFYIQDSRSKAVVTLDQFYPKFKAININIPVIVAAIKDELPPIIKLGYTFTEGRKIPKIHNDANVVKWRDFLQSGKNSTCKISGEAKTPAVILYSGGTTGTTKGILLTNLNFNALSQQIVATNPMFEPGDKMLPCLFSTVLDWVFVYIQWLLTAEDVCWYQGLLLTVMQN